MKQDKGSVLVIGGGIVGLSSAFYLSKAGWQVTVLDKEDFTDSCSYGNAGMIVPSHFTPLAAPGIVAQGIKWMFDSKSPFYVKPSLSWSMISWGIKFLRHANEKHVTRSAPFIRDLNLYSRSLYDELQKELAADIDLHHKGILMLYKNTKTQDEEIELSHTAQKMGLDIEVLDKAQVQALEPDVQLDVLGAVHYRCDSHLYPQALMQALLAKLQAMGVNLVKHAGVTDITVSNGKITEVIGGGNSYKADKVVMASGAWLGTLAKKAGLNVPVMPGKGYSFLTNVFQGKVQHPALLLEARVALTPMGGKVRIGGTMELAPINHVINRNRLEGIVSSVPKYYPEYTLPVPAESDTWHGFRPCSPDGLPYLGASSKVNNLVIAGGLGMMGLSLGPAVGRVVADIIEEQPSQVKVEIFNPERFN